MLKTVLVTGYAVNKRGHTVGIRHSVTAVNADAARVEAERLTIEDGYQHVRIGHIQEVVNA